MRSCMTSHPHGQPSRHTGCGRSAIYGIPALALSCLVSVTPAIAQSTATADEMIAEALTAAPANIRDTAIVSDFSGNILRDGTSDYTCFPAPDSVAGPMCMDAEWRRWMAAWMGGTPFTAERVAVAYMLAGDAAEGGASNSDPAAPQPTADNEWVVEGPHMMVIAPDPAAFAGLPTTIQTDGPYVMWSGTPYAHLMVPVAARPEQRAVPTQ